MDDHDLSTSDEMIPTGELLKRRRKEEYARAKAKAKEEREAAKRAAAAKREADKTAKDDALWAAIKKGDDL